MSPPVLSFLLIYFIPRLHKSECINKTHDISTVSDTTPLVYTALLPKDLHFVLLSSTYPEGKTVISSPYIDSDKMEVAGLLGGQEALYGRVVVEGRVGKVDYPTKTDLVGMKDLNVVVTLLACGDIEENPGPGR